MIIRRIRSGLFVWPSLFTMSLSVPIDDALLKHKAASLFQQQYIDVATTTIKRDNEILAYTKRRKASSLTLAMLLYIHSYFQVIWFCGLIYISYWKVQNFETTNLYRILSFTLIAILFLVDFFRIRLGATGNSNERVPELAGMFLLSLCPTLPILVYFLGFQRLQDLVTPFEYVINSTMAAMLVPEMALSFMTATHSIHQQSEQFYISIKSYTVKDPVKNIRNTASMD